MDSETATKFYEILESGTTAIHNGVSEYNAMDEKINSDLYAEKLKKDEFIPKRAELKNQYEKAYNTMLSDAYAFIDEYESAIRDMDVLHPEEITDDIKLLQSGIKLKERDINSMLSRNEGNRTMQQLILRYAEDNGIETGTVYREALGEKTQEINNMRMIVDAYKKYVYDENALDVLQRFFVTAK